MVIRVDAFQFFASLGVDLIVVALLAFALFYRRHRDREMAISISAINITLWALTGALASYTLSLGVGFALFAVISIIRLRSAPASWVSMAYLLVGLGSGLIVGLTGFNLAEKIMYAAFLVLVMFIVDAPWFLPNRSKDMAKTSITLPGGNIDPDSLRSRAEEMLGVQVLEFKVKQVTLDPVTVKLDVHYRKHDA